MSFIQILKSIELAMAVPNQTVFYSSMKTHHHIFHCFSVLLSQCCRKRRKQRVGRKQDRLNFSKDLCEELLASLFEGLE